MRGRCAALKGNTLLKRLAMTLLCAIIALPFAATPITAVSEGNDGDTLVVGVPANRSPIFYRDEATGDIVGIGVDLLRSATQKAGYSVTFKFIEEETLKDALDSPGYDLLMPFGSAITSASGRQSVVSENLIQTPFTLVTEGNQNLPEMNALRVGMLHSLGGAAETIKQLYPGIEITLFEAMPEAVNALRAGEVDALLHNSYVWSYVLQKPAYSDLTVQPSAMFSMDFRAGTLDTPKGREIIERLNEGVAMMPDTRRQAIILDYTTRRLYRYDFSDYLHQYGLVATLGILLVVALIAIAVMRIRGLRREHEQELRQLLDHDPLTGILSMNGFRKQVEALLQAHPDAPYFISYNNIRDFKFINDSLGREAGDELLKFWARRSLESMTDEEAIGRIESDHFVVLRHIAGEEQMRSDEKNVFMPLRDFFINQGKENRVQICSGIYVLTPKDYRQIDVDHMLDLARVAEKRARERRKNDYEFYNPEQWEKGRQIANVINYLPSALQSGDIQVWYQPQVKFGTGEIIGAEALCRWDHSKLGFLHPSDFISTLEESGHIYELDAFVWDKVCQDLHRWNAQGHRRAVSVNVSRDDIREDRDIAGHFRNLIQTYGLTPDQLRIEITETAYVENPELLISTTEKLRSYGFQVEMDDFGSGYSSLHMLKEVPVDRIKLDLHFLTESGDSEKCRIIVGCMIQMVHLLGLELITEGVETIEQARFLHSKGSDEMQGFYFYKPMPVEEFEARFIPAE